MRPEPESLISDLDDLFDILTRDLNNPHNDTLTEIYDEAVAQYSAYLGRSDIQDEVVRDAIKEIKNFVKKSRNHT